MITAHPDPTRASERATCSAGPCVARHAASLVGVLATVALPKCPACLAAWTATLGLGTAAQGWAAAPWAAPVLIASLFLPAALLRLRTPAFYWTVAVAAAMEATYLGLPIALYLAGGVLATAVIVRLWKHRKCQTS